MRFFVMGGSGFIGKALINHLSLGGHEVAALLRRAGAPAGRARPVSGDPLKEGPWMDEAAASDCIVNLVGRNIMERWNLKVKQEILETRVRSATLAAQAACRSAGQSGGQGGGQTVTPGVRRPILINANAVGFYGDSGAAPVAEDAPQGPGFLAEVCAAWQSAALAARECGARVAVLRFGAVLGASGGALTQMLPAFKSGVGGRLGSGRQYFSWVHLTDLCRAIEFTAAHPDLSGPVNVTAPEIPTNAEFTRLLGHILRRPTLLPVPAPILRLLFGEVAGVLLTGQRTLPRALLQAGFAFAFPDPESALRDLLAPGR